MNQPASLKVVRAGPQDREAYDRAVAGSGKPHFMQLWGWGEVKRATGWEPLRFLATRGGRVTGAMTVLARRLPGLGTVFYAPTGPAVDYADQETVRSLLAAAAEEARRHRAFVLRVDPDIPAGRRDAVELLTRLGFRRGTEATAFEALQPRFVMRLELAPTPEETLARFESKTRYNIRYAARQGVTARAARDEQDLAAFYRLLQLTAARQRFAVRAFSYYEALWRHLLVPGHGRIFLAEHQGRPVAGIMVFRCGDTAWYLYGGTDYEARKVMPSHAAQWAAIQWAIAEGCRIYDFRGVSGNLDPSDPHYGLYRFKKGFGAELVEYVGEFERIYAPARYWAFRAAFAARRRLLRALRRSRGGATAPGATE
ncbi:peptidoglycan bridge formation glycyltransferase FemA/FemB family protein [Thermaerobacter sp. PB12/4term]|uniref:lipid II:glycine glycyltransferase FemX n=1 Tax=Thermaerobacter sp. PB12/4term TaxID=2293838 RepID=UPI000E3279C7|nr:peptidoglycan bridge formation glycyltransferase FemA/FemB family protein [Thermaerobacter sp. PB12/4term]QIA26534.1 peptidoglycan bridge formation glycyltransferase FemA/FemB family protein [Thermaerobacter sp. PB12/4term]